jgi:DedD protein
MIPPLDTALKHRLTGAVILVLLAVLLLPELLTGSGRSAPPALQSSADTADGERRLDIDLTEGARNAPTPGAAAQSAPPVTLPVPAVTEPPPTVAAADPSPADPVPADRVDANPVAANSVAAEASSPPSRPASTPSASEAYFVQLGVFENRASATNLERKLRDGRFTVVVEQIERSGRALFRVRVGPEPDRAAASALQERLAKAGHKGSVVK